MQEERWLGWLGCGGWLACGGLEAGDVVMFMLTGVSGDDPVLLIRAISILACCTLAASSNKGATLWKTN